MSGLTVELPYNPLQSVATYRCSYSLQNGPWVYALTITNLSPDHRQFQLAVFCNGAQLIFGVMDVEGANEAINACEGGTMSLLGCADCGCLCRVVIPPDPTKSNAYLSVGLYVID